VSAHLSENSPDLLAYLRRRLAPEDAADALAEVMVVAWRRGRSMPADPLEARLWLFGIARLVLANAQRGAVRRTRLGARLRETLRGAAPASDSGLEVRDALARLDPELAELVRLIHWDGFAIAEAAQLLGIPASTARGRYQRARQLLKEALSPAEVRS
jgi:RNA polymerase sigma factor (sigma-70 family)